MKSFKDIIFSESSIVESLMEFRDNHMSCSLKRNYIYIYEPTQNDRVSCVTSFNLTTVSETAKEEL